MGRPPLLPTYMDHVFQNASRCHQKLSKWSTALVWNVVEGHVVVADLEGAHVHAVDAADVGEHVRVRRKVEADVELQVLRRRRQRVRRRVLLEEDVRAALGVGVVRVGHEVDVVAGDERVDLVGPREDVVAAVLEPDREDPLGEDRVHDVRRLLGLDAHRDVVERSQRHRADGGLRVRVDAVDRREAVDDVVRRDERAVAEVVVRLERDVPDLREKRGGARPRRAGAAPARRAAKLMQGAAPRASSLTHVTDSATWPTISPSSLTVKRFSLMPCDVSDQPLLPSRGSMAPTMKVWPTITVSSAVDARRPNAKSNAIILRAMGIAGCSSAFC